MAASPAKKENNMMQQQQHTHPAKMCITDTCKRPFSAGRKRNKLPKVLSAPRTAPGGISTVRCGGGGEQSMVTSSSPAIIIVDGPGGGGGWGLSAGTGDWSSCCMEEIMKEAMMGPPQKKARDIFRDKESLVEEIYNLKTALADQDTHFKLHQVHHRSMSVENRQEVRVERDIFASEVRRLQKELRKLHHLHHKIITGNAEVARLRALIHGFNLHGQQLSQTISSYKESLEQKRKEIQMWKATGEAAMEEAKRQGQRLRELDEHSSVLQGLLDRERVEKRRMEKRTRLLEEDIRRLDREAEAKKLKDALAKAKRDAKARRNKMKKKGKGKKGKGSKLDDKKDKDSSSAAASSSATTPKNPADDIAQMFLKEVKVATHRFIEDAPASKPGSPKSPAASRSKAAAAEGGSSLPSSSSAAVETTSADPGAWTLLPAGGGSDQTGQAGASKLAAAGGGSSSVPTTTTVIPGEEEQHRTFEKIRRQFTKRVDEAENDFLRRMEGMEYGEGGRPNMEAAGRPKSDEEARRIAEEKLHLAQLEVQRLAEEARLAQEEANRLLAELEALRKAHMVPPGGKRWKKENLTILVDDKDLPPSEYTSDIQDQGTEISIEIAIKSPTSEADQARMRAEAAIAAMKKKAEEDEARRRLEEAEAKRKAEEAEEDEARRRLEEAEAKRKAAEEEEAMRKKREEEEAMRKKREEEEAMHRKQDAEAKKTGDVEEAQKRMEEEARRRKAEEDEAAKRRASFAAHNKKLQDELAEANRKAAEEEEERARRKASMDARNKKLQEELEAANRRAAEEEAKRKAAEASSSAAGEQSFFDSEMHGVIKDNIKEVLGHLETISDAVQKKAGDEQGEQQGPTQSPPK